MIAGGNSGPRKARATRWIEKILRAAGVRAWRGLRAKRKHAENFARYWRSVHALASEDSARTPLTPRDSPLISFVIPVFRGNAAHLDDFLDSALRQPPGLCEFLFSDAGSNARETLDWLNRLDAGPGIAVVRGRASGLAAAANAAIAEARAPWVGLVDPDDALDPFAVDRIARALNENPDCAFLYTDEVVADERLRPREAVLKPAWDPVLLAGIDYVGRLALFRRDRLVEIGGPRHGFQGPGDYDLVLRFTRGLGADRIRHLPYPAYIRRGGARSKATPVGTAIAHGEKKGPRVSVVIPSRDAFPLIRRVLRGLLEFTDYSDLEIVVVDNGSTDPEVLALYRDLARREPRFRAQIDAEPFNFSRAINRGVAMANGELVLLLNNDVEIVDRDWLAEMAACFDYENVGIVGAKLLYPNRTIQHAGVIAGLGGYAGHWFIGQDKDFPGPMGRLRLRQSLSVVTGACMLVSKACLRAVGPFDEATFPIAYNDVDFCLRAANAGFRIVWTPFACLVHHESATRGSDETKENIDRFNRDKANLRERHHTDTLEDRAFNPWYSKHESYPYPVALDALPKAR